MAERLHAMLFVVNAAYAGGPAAEQLAERLSRQAAGPGEVEGGGKRWRESKGGKKHPERRPVQT